MKFSGNAGNAAAIVIVIFTAAIVMFIFPLMKLADTQDDTTQLEAQKIITEFANKVRLNAIITQSDIDNLYTSLNALGRAYDVEMTVQIGDDNPSKKTSDGYTKIDGTTYYILKTTQVLENLPLNLKEGDTVMFYAVPVDQSVGDQLRNWAFKITGSKARTVQDGGIVTATSTGN